MGVPQIRLSQQDLLVIEDTWWQVLSRDSAGATLRMTTNGCVNRTFTHFELQKLFFERKLKIARGAMLGLSRGVADALTRPLESFTAKQQEEALMRLDYVQACDRFFAKKLYPKRPEEGYARIGRVVARYRRNLSAYLTKKPVRALPLEEFGGTTIREWYWRWTRSGRQLAALVPLDHLKGSDEKKTDPVVLRVVADHVRERWLTLERPTVTQIHDTICQEIALQNETRAIPLAEPSEMLVRRWIDEHVDEYDEVFYRKGKEEADQLFRNVRRAPRATRPLQRVQVDHTPLDVLLVLGDGRPGGQKGRGKGKPVLKRAWLTVLIDEATRVIIGFHIGYERPSWTSVMQALRMAVLPKDLGTVPGVISEWPVFGVPEILIMDNGREFHSNSIKAAAGQLLMELRYAPKRKPHLKGKVERFLREVARDFLGFVPGRTFANVKERGDYDSEGMARLTLDKTIEFFTRWLVDIYHQRPHGGLMGRTPLHRWQDLQDFGVRLPPDAADLDALIGLVVDRTIQSIGIEYMGLVYSCDALHAMRRRPGHLGKLWMVKGDPLDLTVLLVLDEDHGKWLSVPCKHPELIEGLTLAMWRDVVELARALTREGQRVARATLLRAREQLMTEYAAMGGGSKPKGAMTPAEIDWFRSHVDDPFFDVALDASAPSGEAEHTVTRRAQAPRELAAAEDAARGTALPEFELAGEDAVVKRPVPVERAARSASNSPPKNPPKKAPSVPISSTVEKIKADAMASLALTFDEDDADDWTAE